MEVVGSVVAAELIVHAVQGKPALGDAVGEAAHSGADAAALVGVLRQGVVAQGHVHQLTGLVVDQDAPDGGAVVQDLHGAAALGGQGPGMDLGAVLLDAKGSFADIHRAGFLSF